MFVRVIKTPFIMMANWKGTCFDQRNIRSSHLMCVSDINHKSKKLRFELRTNNNVRVYISSLLSISGHLLSVSTTNNPHGKFFWNKKKLLPVRHSFTSLLNVSTVQSLCLFLYTLHVLFSIQGLSYVHLKQFTIKTLCQCVSYFLPFPSSH